ncbi:cupin [Streptomyces sp. HSW2009]|uniref:1,2-dihydroxy-3-keto-5-methylthiopentene dioxygenase n=1 Tax=Streptomyces sp. HSW2009 TaxID=3142890 RepID=UPI0032EF9816
MTLLQVMPDDAPQRTLLRTRDHQLIAAELAAHGVLFERWPVRGAIDADTGDDAVLARYATEGAQLRARAGLRLVDVATLLPEENPAWRERVAQSRGTFLDEHRHAEDEVRFFAHGSGCFYLRLGGRVYAVLCEAGDLLSVPAATRHWFDMGPHPEFVAIRFFAQEDGWVGDFTGETIARRFPLLDDLLAAEPTG